MKLLFHDSPFLSDHHFRKWPSLVCSVSVFSNSWVIIISKHWSEFFSSISILGEYLFSIPLSTPALNAFLLVVLQRYFLNMVLQELEALIKSWFIVNTQMPPSQIERREALKRSILASWVSHAEHKQPFCSCPGLY